MNKPSEPIRPRRLQPLAAVAAVLFGPLCLFGCWRWFNNPLGEAVSIRLYFSLYPMQHWILEIFLVAHLLFLASLIAFRRVDSLRRLIIVPVLLYLLVLGFVMLLIANRGPILIDLPC